MTSTFSKSTFRQSSLESLELAELSNDRKDIVKRFVEEVWGEGWKGEIAHP